MMMLSTVAAITHGTRQGDDVRFDAVSIDSRTLEAGALFVAIKGPHFDGHDFLDAAAENGAVAALVSQPGIERLPVVRVSDTRQALGQMAASWRTEFNLPLIAVTGSNGKTTVKEMLSAILCKACDSDPRRVLATRGNLNNDLGVPLTLLRLRAQHNFAVIEMGMNHAGEISYLTQVAHPDVAVITNAAAAHLQGLGDVAGVAQAKGEIFEGLAVGGTAVINADDEHNVLWRQLAGRHRVITFAVDNPADVRADYQLHASGSDVNIDTPWGNASFTLQRPGRHNVANAMAAAAAAGAAGVSLTDIVDGLSGWHGVNGRLQVHELDGLRVIDDTYNANPSSMRAALDVLAAYPGSKLFVMGDMGELGDAAAAMHEEICQYAIASSVDRLFTCGPLSCQAASQHGSIASCYDSHISLLEHLADHLRQLDGKPVTVLVKGSRSMAMERVVQGLLEQAGGS
jgi:UDP-N-acetylmuramoyl-tripeptide--D-alanyl-D-alanine ligase